MIAASVMMAGAPYVAEAQMKIIPKDKLNAVNDPALSSDSSFLKFETLTIEAERMNEDDAPKTYA